MNPYQEFRQQMTRRHFFARGSHAVGWAALASLLGQHSGPQSMFAAETANQPQSPRHTLQHFPGKAKHVIYLHMVGGPSQMDLYRLQAGDGGVVRQGPARLGPHGPAAHDDDLRPGAVSDRAVEVQVRPARRSAACGSASCCRSMAKMVDDMCFIRSMHTEAINHEPAISYMQTGNQITGRPCLGAWASYGLGSLNDNLPTFVVLVAEADEHRAGAGDLGPAVVAPAICPASMPACRSASGGDPILYINNPPGVPANVRRKTLDGLKSAERDELPARSAIRKRTRASSSTSWPSACRPACRS